MRRKMIAAIMTIQIISNSGCWDYRDINSTAIPQLGAYDVHEESLTALGNLPADEQQVDLTVVIPTVSPELVSKFLIHKSSGLLISSARGQNPYSLPGEYTPAFASAIVFGDALAVTGLNKVSDALARGALNPHTVNYVVAEGRGENILRVPTTDFPSMGDYIRMMVRSSNKRTFIPATTLHQFEVDQNPGKNPVMPLLTIKDERVTFAGAAIFNKDKMIGKVDLNETQYLVMLRGIESTGNLPFIINKEGQISEMGSINVNNKRKVKVERDGDGFTFTINILLAGQLAEHSSGARFTENYELRTAIEEQIAADVTAGCNKFIKKIQEEYKVDCIDISKYALAKWRNELQDKVDEPSFIENANIKVNVKVKLQSIGGEN